MSKAIHKKNLQQLWERLSARGPLYLPAVEGPVTLFKPWQEGMSVNLEAVSTAVSPKEIFMPREEVYLQFRREGRALELQPVARQETAVTVFGLHPCDLKAVELLDMVFQGQDPPDLFYSRRRNSTTVVVLACRQSDPYCFCGAFGVNPADAPGADLLSWWDNDKLILKPLGGKGEELVCVAGDLLEDCAAADRPASPEAGDLKLDPDNDPEWWKERFDDPAWENLSRSCLGCGICTYICPTCHCFDLQDYGCREQGERFRCWDSCIFAEFTLMAGGHNPRPGRKERLRNRFLHKLQYFPEKFNTYGCVGCGRCLRSCPVNLDIVRVVNTFRR